MTSAFVYALCLAARVRLVLDKSGDIGKPLRAISASWQGEDAAAPTIPFKPHNLTAYDVRELNDDLHYNGALKLSLRSLFDPAEQCALGACAWAIYDYLSAKASNGSSSGDSQGRETIEIQRALTAGGEREGVRWDDSHILAALVLMQHDGSIQQRMGPKGLRYFTAQEIAAESAASDRQ